MGSGLSFIKKAFIGQRCLTNGHRCFRLPLCSWCFYSCFPWRRQGRSVQEILASHWYDTVFLPWENQLEMCRLQPKIELSSEPDHTGMLSLNSGPLEEWTTNSGVPSLNQHIYNSTQHLRFGAYHRQESGKIAGARRPGGLLRDCVS